MTTFTTQSVRRAWLMLGVALALLWGVPQNGAAAPAGQTITGYVQNADLRRVAQATVELRDPEGTLVTSATTTDAGGFLLITPNDGVFSVQAIQDTYRSEHVVLTIDREAPDPVVLTLTETQEIALEIVEPLVPIKPNSSGETYSVSRKDIEALPRGNNLDLHDVLLTIPSAVYGSLKQAHIRQEHANLQFRIDGVPIPDTVTSQFTDLLSPRAWERADILLGGMEAQYGNRTTAVIDITSKSGTKPGFGSIGVFGGSNETVLPSFEYGGDGRRPVPVLRDEQLSDDQPGDRSAHVGPVDLSRSWRIQPDLPARRLPGEQPQQPHLVVLEQRGVLADSHPTGSNPE